MSRIDTTSTAEFLTRGLQTGLGLGMERRRMALAEQDRAEQMARQDRDYGLRMRLADEASARMAEDRARAEQERKDILDATRLAVNEQLDRTASMRPTYGETPGPWSPAVDAQPMPDDADVKWRRAADAAYSKGNVQGLQVLLELGKTREERSRRVSTIGAIRRQLGSGPIPLGGYDGLDQLLGVLEAGDGGDPTELVARHLSQIQGLRAKQQEAAALAGTLGGAYAKTGIDPSVASGMGTLAAHNAPVPMPARAGATDPLADDLLRIQFGSVTQAASEAAKEYESAVRGFLSVNVDKKGNTLGAAAPTEAEVIRAGQPADTDFGDGIADMSETDHQRLRGRVEAWRRMQSAKAWFESASKARDTFVEKATSRNKPAAASQTQGAPGLSVPKANQPPTEQKIVETIDQMILRGATDEEIEAAMKARGVGQ